MKRFLRLASLVAIFLLSSNMDASNDYTLKLKSGEVTLTQNNPNTTLSAVAGNISEQYVIVQFTTVPTEIEKETLQQNGVSLLEYLPLHAFIAKINNPSEVSLQSLNIRAVAPFTANYKFSKAVKNNENPG